MSTLLFENEHLFITCGQKSDGMFGAHPSADNQSEKTARDHFTRLLGITHTTFLRPRNIPLSSLKTKKEYSSEKILFKQKIITTSPLQTGQALGVLTADCPVLIIINSKTSAVGIQHLGWWQLYWNAPHRFFKLWFKRNPGMHSDLMLLTTPGICGDCFTLKGWRGMVRIILFTLSPWRKHLRKSTNKTSLDLQGILRDQLSQLGFDPQQITYSYICTYEDAQYSSYRREGKKRPSSNFILIKGK